MFALLLALLLQSQEVEQPNILWLSFEDHGPQLGCYGDEYATTPTLDGLAAEGVRYQRCWSNAPVCSTARTTLITGRHATSLGAHHQRSRLKLPAGVHFFPQLLRKAGYFCTNNRKEDYNLAKPSGTWDMSNNRAHWRARKPGQPFFAVFNVTVSHESQIRKRPHTLVHDPDEFELPPYYPNLPEIRRDWAQEYDKGTEMDARLATILAELDEDGLREDTIIFAFGDHGSGMPRHKRWPGNSGQHVPLIIVIPEKWSKLRPAGYSPGTELERLVSFVDFGPTVMSLAGIAPDQDMQGIPFLGAHAGEAKQYLFGYRGRMDERDDCVRSITDGRYVYMWTPTWARPHGAHVSYQFETPTTQAWYDYAVKHADAPAEIRDYWLSPRGAEDLFDLQADPHETRDLSRQEDMQQVRDRMRDALHTKIIDSHDLGFIPEHLAHVWDFQTMKPVTRASYMHARRASRSDPSYQPHNHFQALGQPEQQDAVLADWWQAIAMRSKARSKMTIDGDAWRDCDEPGTRVVLATAALLNRSNKDALEVLVRQAGKQQSNYFIRLLAWQALDEVVSHGGLQAVDSQGLRERIAEISLDIPGLDRAFNFYLPRLRDKVLANESLD